MSMIDRRTVAARWAEDPARQAEIAGRDAVRSRLKDEAARVAAILARATPAEGCGPAIPIAPARGPSRLVTPNVVMPDARSKSGYKVEETGWRGFKAVQAIDIFDDLERRAAARKEPPPFSKGQVVMARRYRDLVERHDAGGMKCASLEARSGGSGRSGGEFIDAYLAEGDEIRRLRRLIGNGAAMAVRRVRPSARGGEAASIITDRYLVDAICLHGKSFRAVLRAHGWVYDGKRAKMLVSSLAASLDRMRGLRADGKNLP